MLFRSKNISAIAAEIYSIDLLGSAIGALLVATLLVPLIGLVKVCILIGILNFVAALVVLVKRKRYMNG